MGRSPSLLGFTTYSTKSNIGTWSYFFSIADENALTSNLKGESAYKGYDALCNMYRLRTWRTRLECRGIYLLVNLLAMAYSEATNARDDVCAVLRMAFDVEDSAIYVDYNDY